MFGTLALWYAAFPMLEGGSVQGAFGVVVRAHADVVVKRALRDDCKHLLEHEFHVAKYLGCWQTFWQCTFFAEALTVEDGALYMKDAGLDLLECRPHDARTKGTVSVQITQGLAFMHTLGVAHRDVKMENLCWDGTFVRYVDFATVTYKAWCVTRCGSKSYCAPEILEGKFPYNAICADMWSLGVTLVALWTDHLPFEVAHLSDTRFASFVVGSCDAFDHADMTLEVRATVTAALKVVPAERRIV
jgi:serine/threonine protein kinase